MTLKVEARANSVNSQPNQTARPFRTIVVAVLVVWGIYAWWALGRVQSTGKMLRNSLESNWPSETGPPPGTREKLVATADALASGQAWTFGETLIPVPPPTDDERAAASKFLSVHSELRARLLTTTDAARDMAADGLNVDAVREALARAYQQAVQADETAVTSQLALAERLLTLADSPSVGAYGPVDEKNVAQLAAAIEPAYQLSQDLMTEGGAAVEKVLIVAARSFAERRFGDAASNIRLTGELLGAQMTLRPEAEIPEWFVVLAEREIPGVDEQQATAAVELAEAMALSMAPSDTVAALLKKARRELDTGRYDTSAWWAGVTLNALGMSDAAIAAATDRTDDTTENELDVEDNE